jgi:hypothetical protein
MTPRIVADQQQRQAEHRHETSRLRHRLGAGEALDRAVDIGATAAQITGHGDEDEHGNQRESREYPQQTAHRVSPSCLATTHWRFSLASPPGACKGPAAEDLEDQPSLVSRLVSCLA